MQDPSLEERQAALFNSTCVHAGNGDVEFAQVTLRGTVFPLSSNTQCSGICDVTTMRLGKKHHILTAMVVLMKFLGDKCRRYISDPLVLLIMPRVACNSNVSSTC